MLKKSFVNTGLKIGTLSQRYGTDFEEQMPVFGLSLL